MISLGVIQFFFYLGLPWLIGKGFSYLSKMGKRSKRGSVDASTDDASETKMMPLKDRAIFAIVIVFLVHYAWFCFGNGAPKNFFQLTNTPTNAPGFQLRENYKAFLQAQAEDNPAFAEAMKKLGDLSPKVEEEDIRLFRARRHAYAYSIFGYYVNPEDVGSDSESSTAPYLSEEEILYEKYQYIFDRLKSPAKRTLYLKYGEDAFLDCHFCQDDYDYLYFIGPLIASSYVAFLIAGGALSILKRKSNWRNIFILFCGVLAICELFYYIAPNEMSSLDLYSSIFPEEDKASTFQKLEIVRKIFFGAALLLGLLFDNGHKRSEIDIIHDMGDCIEETIAIHQTARLQKLAMMYDGALRKFYMEHYEKAEKSWNSDEFNRKVSDVMKKYDMDAMSQTASELVDDIVEEYVEEELVPEDKTKKEPMEKQNTKQKVTNGTKDSAKQPENTGTDVSLLSEMYAE
jgi:hypothetical protein